MLDWFEWTPVTMWMVAKAIGLLVIVGAVSFWYSYKTGRSLSDDVNARRRSRAPERSGTEAE